MSAFTLILRATLRQLLAGKRVFALLALSGLPALVMFLAGRNMTEQRAYDFFHEEAPLGITMIIVLPVISLILAAAALGEDRRSDMMPFLVMRPVPRWVVAAAKVAAGWLAAFAVAAAGAVLTAVALGLHAGDWSPLLPLLLLVLVNTLGYAALFVPLGYLMERAVLAGLAYIFIWEAGLSLGIRALASLSISRIGLSVYVGLVPESARLLRDPLGDVTPGAGGGIAKAVVLAALAVMLTVTLIRRRDLV